MCSAIVFLLLVPVAVSAVCCLRMRPFLLAWFVSVVLSIAISEVGILACMKFGRHEVSMWDDVIRWITVPSWAVPIAFVTGVFVRLATRQQHHPAGQCRRCGYCLTGNVSGICPECGTPCSRQNTEGDRKEFEADT